MRSFVHWLSVIAVITIPFASAARPVVVELFTSQGCSSCPPADKLLMELAEDESLLALSFHIDYWDRLGWQDPFSLAASTNRQRGYVQAMKLPHMFTPQAVVDGTTSLNGASEDGMKSAISEAREHLAEVPMTLASDGKQLTLTVGTTADKALHGTMATIWVIGFDRISSTQVITGENAGRTLRHRNNVMSIEQLATWQNTEASFTLPVPTTDGVAVLLQAVPQGRILGAASYLKP